MNNMYLYNRAASRIPRLIKEASQTRGGLPVVFSTVVTAISAAVAVNVPQTDQVEEVSRLYTPDQVLDAALLASSANRLGLGRGAIPVRLTSDRDVAAVFAMRTADTRDMQPGGEYAQRPLSGELKSGALLTSAQVPEASWPNDELGFRYRGAGEPPCLRPELHPEWQRDARAALRAWGTVMLALSYAFAEETTLARMSAHVPRFMELLKATHRWRTLLPRMRLGFFPTATRLSYFGIDTIYKTQVGDRTKFIRTAPAAERFPQSEELDVAVMFFVASLSMLEPNNIPLLNLVPCPAYTLDYATLPPGG